MGQRHQVYLRHFNKDTKKHETVGLHHQWLYGQTAIILLKNFVNFYKKTDKKYNVFQNSYQGSTLDLLKMNYSYSPSDGYLSRVHTFDNEEDKDCLENPEYGDNNDGITLIDIPEKGKPKICLLNFYDKQKVVYNELEDGFEPEGDIVEGFRPISPYEYVELYYDLNYYIKNNKEKSFVAKVKRDAKFIDNNSVLMTVEDIKNMFPKWDFK